MGKIIEDKLQQLLDKALELGAAKAKLIDTSTVVVGDWVRWKCRYGCQFYNKDAFHAPCSPNADETRKVIGEYNKALLINSPNGVSLSLAALKLEYEAGDLGYYKAFAIVAIPFRASGGTTCPTAPEETPAESTNLGDNTTRPMMEACGIDVYKTAWANGFEISTKKETYGKWNYFALVLIE